MKISQIIISIVFGYIIVTNVLGSKGNPYIAAIVTLMTVMILGLLTVIKNKLAVTKKNMLNENIKYYNNTRIEINRKLILYSKIILNPGMCYTYNTGGGKDANDLMPGYKNVADELRRMAAEFTVIYNSLENKQTLINRGFIVSENRAKDIYESLIYLSNSIFEKEKSQEAVKKFELIEKYLNI